MNLPWDEIFRQLTPASGVLLVALLLLWRAYQKVLGLLFSTKLELMDEKIRRLRERVESLQQEVARLQVQVQERERNRGLPD